MSEKELTEMDDDSDNLHWNALNYRTAPTQFAEEMWQALAACVERKVTAEREACARLIDKIGYSHTSGLSQFVSGEFAKAANAIRMRK